MKAATASRARCLPQFAAAPISMAAYKARNKPYRCLRTVSQIHRLLLPSFTGNMLRRFVLLFALSFILYLPAAQACRQKYIEWYKYAPCKAKKSDIDGECWEIQRKMRDYSNANQK